MRKITDVQMDEILHFNLKYLHLMNKIRVLMKDAITLKQQIKFIESGDIHDNLFIGEESCRN